jgi:hypothetical protein
MLTKAELEGMAKTVESLMTDACQIIRRTVNATGADDETIAGTTRCSRRPLRENEQLLLTKVVGTVVAKVRVPLGVDIQSTDALRFSDGEYEVVEVLPDATSFAVQREVLCVKIT